MKKRTVIFYSVWAILSILIFSLVAHFIFNPSLDKFEDNVRILKERQKIIEADFDQVYLYEDYNIYPSDNGIVIELIENNARLKCYYTMDKVFVDSEVVGAPVYIENFARAFIWVIIGIVSAFAALGIIGVFVGIFDVLNKVKHKRINKNV